jgi:hypothetical protein
VKRTWDVRRQVELYNTLQSRQMENVRRASHPLCIRSSLRQMGRLISCTAVSELEARGGGLGGFRDVSQSACSARSATSTRSGASRRRPRRHPSPGRVEKTTSSSHVRTHIPHDGWRSPTAVSQAGVEKAFAADVRVQRWTRKPCHSPAYAPAASTRHSTAASSMNSERSDVRRVRGRRRRRGRRGADGDADAARAVAATRGAGPTGTGGEPGQLRGVWHRHHLRRGGHRSSGASSITHANT